MRGIALVFLSRALISTSASSSACSPSLGCLGSGVGRGNHCLGVACVVVGADHGKSVGIGEEAVPTK